jgi:hypothetical protein
MKQEFFIPATDARLVVVQRIGRVLENLPMLRWRVELSEAKPVRTESQNKLLWAIYTQILAVGGEEMGGWTKDDLHDFFLIDHFGSETYEVFGKKRIRPLRRSKKLNKQEFSNYVAHIQQFMAERGVYIADPGGQNG